MVASMLVHIESIIMDVVHKPFRSAAAHFQSIRNSVPRIEEESRASADKAGICLSETCHE